MVAVLNRASAPLVKQSIDRLLSSNLTRTIPPDWLGCEDPAVIVDVTKLIISYDDREVLPLGCCNYSCVINTTVVCPEEETQSERPAKYLAGIFPKETHSYILTLPSLVTLFSTYHIVDTCWALAPLVKQSLFTLLKEV